MLRIKLDAQFMAIRQRLAGAPAQIPFAVSLAVNLTARKVKDGLREEMPHVFDRPTPYTLNALQLTPGTKAEPSATVWLKDRADSFLGPEVFGGGRKTKAFERAMQAIGVMPPGTIAVIPRAASWASPLDRYGNLSGGFIERLLSYFGGAEYAAQRAQAGFIANLTARGRAKRAQMGRTKEGYLTIGGVVYFASQGPGRQTLTARGKVRGQHLPAGIWAKRGTHGSDVAPVLLFVKPANYPIRFRFFEIGERIAAKEFPIQARAAVLRAISTTTRFR